ncbi:unnamed protein product [Paramecium sonneborni]|uniref:Uncharacterized protein n=1 Tax=Paramecium sonneborni TaxID=65129 RepID=A0A8S1L5G1_9CILI|nr:unnamed protein product [Paramecium sonneborni]
MVNQMNIIFLYKYLNLLAAVSCLNSNPDIFFEFNRIFS